MGMGKSTRETWAEITDPRIKRCDCGKVTTFVCKELWAAPGLVPCNKPLCGQVCSGHRHQSGTMGYSLMTTGSADFLSIKPDGPGVWALVIALCRNIFWSHRQKAQHTWERLMRSISPPAPLPPFKLKFSDGSIFEARGAQMAREGTYGND